MEQEQYDKLLEMLQSEHSHDLDLAWSVIDNLEGNFVLEMQKEQLRKAWFTIVHYRDQKMRANYFHDMEKRLFYAVHGIQKKNK